MPEITNMILRKLFQVKIQSGFFSNVVTQPDLQVLHSWSLLILWGVSVKSFQESLEEKTPLTPLESDTDDLSGRLYACQYTYASLRSC